MVSRRRFLAGLALAPLARRLGAVAAEGAGAWPDDRLSDFCKRLEPVGRTLELEGWYVWCASPIEGPDGKTHVFFSRWPAARGMGGWINSSEIAHAVADSPESPFEYVQTVLAPRGSGFWDGTTCHNPHIQKVGDRYYLFYMGNSNGRTDTKRIGLAAADSLYGPWRRPDRPLLEAGPAGAWDDHCTTNPAYVRHPDGRHWLYYKSWNTAEYNAAAGAAIRGNRKYGLAVAEAVEGPYAKHPANPVIDFSGRGGNTQLEDAFVWWEDGRFRMLARDMGFFDHEVGLYLESEDGVRWSEPKIAYLPVREYVQESPPPPHLRRYGRFERPQLLLRNGRPAYLFVASQGGRHMTASTFVFRVRPDPVPGPGSLD
ncbi:MAG TPA: glycoside hydrolase family protein [Longimicrobiales bacterium]